MKTISTVYVDHEYASDYPKYIPRTKEEIQGLIDAVEPWRLFQRTDLLDKNITHIEVVTIG